MSEPRTYPSGVPCWIDLDPQDMGEARHFYGSLFGWTFEDVKPAGASGSYLIAQLDGQDVGAIGLLGDEPGSGWNTYVAVDDTDRVVRLIPDTGGQVTSPAVDVGAGGRWAAISDPTGAEIRLWQPRQRLGAQLTNAPGTWNFSDLHTYDPALARTFYSHAFEWEADDLGGGAAMWRRPGYGDHLASTVDPGIRTRQAAAGAPPGFADAIAWLAPTADAEVPHWHVTFTVADRDEAVAAAVGLGGSVVSGPVDTEWNRRATVADPEGAVFTLSQFTPPTS